MERATAFRTSFLSSGGVIDWIVAKSNVLASTRYSDGSVLSNLMLKTVPARDCIES